MKMAPPIEEDYHDLLQPVKDAEKSFQIDVANLLYSYIKNFVQGKVPANFNSAALLLQGSSCIYGRKVEYLFNLVNQLYTNLTKNKKSSDQGSEAKKDKAKDRHKESRFNDPFFSTDIKIGKNLSCLKKKSLTKASTTKKSKKEAKKCLFIPVDLLPFEGEEKGDTFYDTRGEAVGNKADYTLNKCKITSSGWLILPTVCRDQIPTANSPPDYTFHCNMLANIHVDEEGDHCNDVDMPCSTPDEGIDMGSELPCSQATPEIPLSQQTDEGLGSMQSTPQEMLSQPLSEPMDGVENNDNAEEIPIDGIVSDLDVPSTSVRRSMRQALKTQEEIEKETAHGEEGNNNATKEEEIVVVKKAIQKKNTCSLPSKLKSKENEQKKESISLYCARTFFHVDNKCSKTGLLSLETEAFKNNSNFLKRLQERAEAIKNATRKTKKAEEIEDEEVDVETLSEPDDMIMPDHLDEDDIVIQNDINDIPLPENAPSADELPQSSNENGVPLCNEEPIDENDLLIKDIKSLDKNSEITARVKAFERRLNPFLNEVEKREAFDINLYGARILNSFDSSETKVRKQTKTFRDFCKGMEQWQIHRYFMALLPLANIGNVSLETEEGPDGEDQIMITLLSKKMHHLRLEEFGNEPTDSAHK